MNSFWSSPIIIIRRILSITGLWPYLTTTQALIRTIIMNVSVLAIYSVQVHSLLSMKYTMDTSSLFYVDNFMANTVMCLTYYVSLYRKNVGLSCLKQILLHWEDIEHTKEVGILLEYASLCRTSTLTILFSSIGFVTFSFLKPSAPLLLDIVIPLNESRPRTLLYPMDWFPESDKYFVELLLLQYFCCILISLGCTSGLSTYLAILQHICAMFRVIECLLENILREEEMELSVVNNSAVYAKIIRIIRFHDATTNFVDVMNTNFNAFALLSGIFASFVSGLRIMQIFAEIERNADIGTLIIPVCQIIFLLIWTFILCYGGQHLSDLSTSIFQKTYETPWYMMSKPMQKLLYVLMMRAGKPSYISVGKMFIVSHELFSTIAQIVISYSTILYSHHRHHSAAITSYETT